MWNPGTMLFAGLTALRTFRPQAQVIDHAPRGGITCTVLGCEELSYGTKGPERVYTVLADCRVYTARVDNVRMSWYDVIEET